MNELALKTVQTLIEAMRVKDADEIKLKQNAMDRENAKKDRQEAS